MIQHGRNNRKVLRLFCVLFCVCFAMLPLLTQAAILYLEPAQGEYHQEDTFIVEVRLNTEGEYINTVKADLKFPQDILEVKDLSRGNSVLTLWVKTPAFSNRDGTISFVGGVPAGYQGWDGLLGRIIFQVRGTDAEVERRTDAEIEFLDSCQVLLNDGFGTPAKLTARGATIEITRVAPVQIPKNEWQEELKKDNLPPESFEIEIQQTPEIFEGKYFIIFSTNDKQTGLDYYQVKEGEKDWQVAESPYLLEDQKLESIIKVRAVDKAGNERTVFIGPSRVSEKISWADILPWIILGLIIGGVIWWIIKSRNRRKTL